MASWEHWTAMQQEWPTEDISGTPTEPPVFPVADSAPTEYELVAFEPTEPLPPDSAESEPPTIVWTHMDTHGPSATAPTEIYTDLFNVVPWSPTEEVPVSMGNSVVALEGEDEPTEALPVIPPPPTGVPSPTNSSIYGALSPTSLADGRFRCALAG